MDDNLTLPSENPYAPPQSPVASTSAEEVTHYEPASGGKRLANLLIDYVAFLALVMGLSVVLVFLDALGVTNGLADRFFGDDSGPLTDVIALGLMVTYYVVMEGVWGRSVGKWITGTKAVNWKTGGRIGLGSLIWRSLARFIPFEPFSFLGAQPGGWHDRMSGTMVVDLKKPLPPTQPSPGARFFPGR